MRVLLMSLTLATAVALALVGAALAAPKPEFRLGFAALAGQMPDVVGEPIEDEHWGPNGDSLQQTTAGLMVWRKADNWTAFTNGSRTWINGPQGVKDRGNDERFEWEAADPNSKPAAPASASTSQDQAGGQQAGDVEQARQTVLRWLARNPQFEGWVWADGVLRREPWDWEAEARRIERDEQLLDVQRYEQDRRNQDLQRMLDEQRSLEQDRLRRQLEQQERDRLQRQINPPPRIPDPVKPSYQPPTYQPPRSFSPTLPGRGW
ncbi:MAG: hypothetical protein ACYC66_00255 [Chloroflexota bacterium]